MPGGPYAPQKNRRSSPPRGRGTQVPGGGAAKWAARATHGGQGKPRMPPAAATAGDGTRPATAASRRTATTPLSPAPRSRACARPGRPAPPGGPPQCAHLCRGTPRSGRQATLLPSFPAVLVALGLVPHGVSPRSSRGERGQGRERHVPDHPRQGAKARSNRARWRRVKRGVGSAPTWNARVRIESIGRS